ncbi:MAG: FixH family protein [Bacteroidota bacterium]
MKNWGTRIFILYTGFVCLIACLVILSMQQKTDLVAKDYYAQELVYQDKLDKINNTVKLGKLVNYEIQDGILTLQFPEGTTFPVSGTVNLFCPSDMEKDQHISFESGENLVGLKLGANSKGMYKLEIDWKSDSQAYYQEGDIHLQ